MTDLKKRNLKSVWIRQKDYWNITKPIYYTTESCFCCSFLVFMLSSLPSIKQMTIWFLNSVSILHIGTWSAVDAAKIICLDWPGWRLSFFIGIGIYICVRGLCMYDCGSLQSGPRITMSEDRQGSSRHVDFIKSTSVFLFSRSTTP